MVVDSGFCGSIIDKIRLKDYSASGLLMSSNNPRKYAQILVGDTSRGRTEEFERLVKLTGRSKTYNKHGSALVQDVQEDYDTPIARKDTRFGEVNRWSAEAQIRSVLRGAGLPPWDVWRYSSYVGLTPQERLGLHSRAEVEGPLPKYRSYAWRELAGSKQLERSLELVECEARE